MIAELIQIKENEQGMVGLFYIDDFAFHCFTLQPDSVDLRRFYIPPGIYIARRFYGVKWKNTFEIIRPGTNGVDGHTALLFHPGNVEEHSEGCVLQGDSVGKLNEQRAVLNSGATFQRFLHYTKNVESFALNIRRVV